MCGGPGDRSVAPMTNTTLIRTLAGSALAALLAVAVLASTAGAAGKTETLKVFSKQLSFTYTTADGTVSQGPPSGPPQAGDAFEIDSLDYRGTHKKHSRKPIGADYLRCQFDAQLEPRCMGYTALHGRSCASAAWSSSAPSGATRTPRCSAARKSTAALTSSSGWSAADVPSPADGRDGRQARRVRPRAAAVQALVPHGERRRLRRAARSRRSSASHATASRATTTTSLRTCASSPSSSVRSRSAARVRRADGRPARRPRQGAPAALSSSSNAASRSSPSTSASGSVSASA